MWSKKQSVVQTTSTDRYLYQKKVDGLLEEASRYYSEKTGRLDGETTSAFLSLKESVRQIQKDLDQPRYYQGAVADLVFKQVSAEILSMWAATCTHHDQGFAVTTVVTVIAALWGC